jgi:hypothetical protein
MPANKSVFSEYINDNPEPQEPEKILRGPFLQPVVPPADRKAAPIERLLSWIMNNFDGTTISVRDICWRGPRPIRDRANALAMAESLVAAGWLAPIKSHRHDRREYRIAGR